MDACYMIIDVITGGTEELLVRGMEVIEDR